MLKKNLARFGKHHLLPNFSLRWYKLGATYRGGWRYSGVDTRLYFPLYKRHYHIFDHVAHPYERAAIESSHGCYLYNNHLRRLWRWR